MGNKLLKIDCLRLSRNLDRNKSTDSLKSHSTSTDCSSSKIELDTTVNKPDNITITPIIHRSDIKVLFLGVDGVLNTTNTLWNNETNGIENNLLHHFKLIFNSTECKIVLSSTWRLHLQYKKILLNILETKCNISNNCIIGETQSIPNCTRSTEIMRFIHTYNSNVSNEYYISQFCAIDRLPLNTYPNSIFIRKHFVKTDENIGLSESNSHKCIRILNGSDDYYKQRFPQNYNPL